jgi:hypothetical protein
MLTVDLNTRGEHEVGGQIGLFESNQATFSRHQECNRGYECVSPSNRRFVALFQLLVLIGRIRTNAQGGAT